MASVAQLEEELNKLSALNKRSAKELDAFAAVSHAIAVRARRITKDIKPWEVAQENIALTIGELCKAARCYYPPVSLSDVLAGRNKNVDDVVRCIDYLIYTEDYLSTHAENEYGDAVLQNTQREIQEIVIMSENLVKGAFINSMSRASKRGHSTRVFITNPNALIGIDKVIQRLGENFNRLEVIQTDVFLLLRNRLRERVEMMFDLSYRDEAEREDDSIEEHGAFDDRTSLETHYNDKNKNNSNNAKMYGFSGVVRPRQLAQSVMDNSISTYDDTNRCVCSCSTGAATTVAGVKRSNLLAPCQSALTCKTTTRKGNCYGNHVRNTRLIYLQGTPMKHYRRGEHRLICISQQARMMLQETMACLEKYVYTPLDNNFAISNVASELVTFVFDIIMNRALRAIQFDSSRLQNPTEMFLESGGQDIGLCIGKRYFRDIIFVSLDLITELWKWKGFANSLPGDPQNCIDYVDVKMDEYLFKARTLLEGYVDAKGALSKHELKRYACMFHKTEWMPSPDCSVHEMCTNLIYFHKVLLTSYYGALKLALCGNVLELNANEEAVKEVQDFIARGVLGTLEDLEILAIATNEIRAENDIYGHKLIFRYEKWRDYEDTCEYHYKRKTKGQLSPEVFVLNNIAYLEQNYRKEECFYYRVVPFDNKIVNSHNNVAEYRAYITRIEDRNKRLRQHNVNNNSRNMNSNTTNTTTTNNNNNDNKNYHQESSVNLIDKNTVHDNDAKSYSLRKEATNNVITNSKYNIENYNDDEFHGRSRQTDKVEHDNNLGDDLLLRNRLTNIEQLKLRRRMSRKLLVMPIVFYICYLLQEQTLKCITDFGRSWEECFPSIDRIHDLREMKRDPHLPLRRKERNAFKKWHRNVTEALEQKLSECQLLIVLDAPTRARLIQTASQSVHAQFATRDAILQSREWSERPHKWMPYSPEEWIKRIRNVL